MSACIDTPLCARCHGPLHRFHAAKAPRYHSECAALQAQESKAAYMHRRRSGLQSVQGGRRAIGRDYLEKAESELFPGRRYHTLSPAERREARARAEWLVARAKAAGSYVDPSAAQQVSRVRVRIRRMA